MWNQGEGHGALGFVAGGIFIVILDQVSKWVVTQYLQPGESVALPGHLVYLTLVHNPGAAFGIFAHATPFLIMLTLGVLAAVWVHRSKVASQPMLLRLGLTLGLAGAVGNLIDRIRLGYVVDFLDVRIWPVFNVADIGIVSGVFLLFWLLMGEGKKEV